MINMTCGQLVAAWRSLGRTALKTNEPRGLPLCLLEIKTDSFQGRISVAVF